MDYCMVCGLTTINEYGRHECPTEAVLEARETILMIELDTYNDCTSHRASEDDLKAELADVRTKKIALQQNTLPTFRIYWSSGSIVDVVKPSNWNNPSEMGTWENEMITWLTGMGVKYERVQ